MVSGSGFRFVGFKFGFFVFGSKVLGWGLVEHRARVCGSAGQGLRRRAYDLCRDFGSCSAVAVTSSSP